MKLIDQDSTDHVEVWTDREGNKSAEKAEKEMYADGWGAVVASRWLIGLLIVSMGVNSFLGYRLSQVTRIDLSNFPIATMVLTPDRQYIGTTVARGKLIDRDDLVPERMWAVVKAWREVVPSGSTMADNRLFVARHLDPQPGALIAEMLEKSPPEKLWTEKSLTRLPVLVGIVPQNRGSGDTWTVLWREELYMPGRSKPEASFEMTASITIRFEPPTDNAGIVLNPLGLRWTALEWNERKTSGNVGNGS